jgi:hypothetical protein
VPELPLVVAPLVPPPAAPDVLVPLGVDDEPLPLVLPPVSRLPALVSLSGRLASFAFGFCRHPANVSVPTTRAAAVARMRE